MIHSTFACRLSCALFAWLGGLSFSAAMPDNVHQELDAAALGVLEVRAGEDLQAAIDKAPAGTQLRLGPGTWDCPIVIAKSLQLVGAGWEETILRVDPQRVGAQSVDSLWKLREAATKGATPEDRAEAVAEFLELGAKQTGLVVQSGQVVISDLQVQSEGWSSEEGGAQTASVSLYDCDVQLTRCAIVGARWDCVQAIDAKRLQVEECLVAGSWMNGVSLFGSANHKGQYEIANSELRNCRHRGVSVQTGSGTSVRIEGSRFSGSLWHGLRYDNCSPEIVGNLFFNNRISGIYASGETAAQVHGNLFRGDSMSCWFQVEDEVFENTFVGRPGLRPHGGGLGVMGKSHPKIERNIFANVGTAVWLSNISGGGDYTSAAKGVHLRDNLFFGNNKDYDAPFRLFASDPDLDGSAGNLFEDPVFRDSEQSDFALAPTSPILKLKIGVALPLPLESAWPLQPAEQPVRRERLGEDHEAK